MSKRKEWEALSEQAQWKMIIGCICKAAHNQGMSVTPCDYAGDTWERLTDKLDSAEKDLLLVVMDAAEAALRHVYRRGKRDAFQEVHDTGDAEHGSMWDVIPDRGSVETQVIIRVELETFYEGLDTKNRIIVDGLAIGKTQTEIAPEVGMSQRAVSKRVQKMRGAFRECFA